MSQNGTDGARENEKQIGARIAIWQQLITDPALSWVLFKNGTVVVLEDPSEDDLAQQAISVLNIGPQVKPTLTSNWSRFRAVGGGMSISRWLFGMPVHSVKTAWG